MPRLSSRWAGVVAIATIVNVAYGVMFYAFSVLISEDAAGGDLGRGELSLAIGAGTLSSGIAGLYVGAVCDYRGIRGVTLAGGLIGAGGMALLALAEEGWQALLIFVVILGPAMAMTFYGPAYVAVERWFGGRRGRALGVLTLAAGVSSTIFLPLTGFLEAELGWRDAVLVLAGIFAVVSLALGVVLPDSRPAAVARDRPSVIDSLREAARYVDPVFWGITAAFFLALVAMQGVFLHQVTYLEEQGFRRESVAYALGVVGLVSLPGRFLIPFASERFDARKISALTFLAMAGATLCLYGADSWWRVGLYIAVFGLFFGAVIPMRAAVMGVLYSGPAYGRVMGLQGLAIALAGAAGPALFGLLRNWTGGYEFPLALAAGLLAGGAAIVVVPLQRRGIADAVAVGP